MVKRLQINNKIEPGRMLKVAPFRKDIRKTIPHTHHNYFEIIYLSAGAGYHYIDSKAYNIEAPVMFFVRKEQVHYWDIIAEPEGFVLIIKKDFVTNSLDNEIKVLLMKISRYAWVHINDTAAIEALFNLMVHENRQEQEYGFQVTEGLLKSLLAKILQQMVAPPKDNLTDKGLYERFSALLDDEEVIKNKVAYYAKLLNTTPQNLNTVCRKATGMAAAEVLSGHILEKAKRLLVYTDNTISEIAAVLDFTDGSHFVKYFKRLTGHTPHAYRKQL